MTDMELRERFKEFGYVTIDTRIDHDILDGAVADLARFFGPDRDVPIHVPHADHGRIQDAWYMSQTR